MKHTQLPDSFIQLIEQKIDPVEPFLSSFDDPVPVSIRLNPNKASDNFQDLPNVSWHPSGKYLTERPIFTLDPSFHAGAYYVQEASSMFLYQALRQTVDLFQPLKVLDLCAAPGGKSTLIASAISSDSFLLANEVIKKRIDPLKHNLTKWGHDNTMISNHDAEDFNTFKGFFDVVCVDAPCSGEGLFRKDPKAVKEWSSDHVAHCSARQRRILFAINKLVKEGGVLIYSTCTYNDEENDKNVEWLTQLGDFENIKLTVKEEWGIVETKYGYQFFPHLVKGEGFYLAVLKKKFLPEGKKSKIKSIDGLNILPKKEIEILTPWVNDVGSFVFYRKPNFEVVAVPKKMHDIFVSVAAQLKKRSFGLNIGTLKNKKFIPSHALAMSHIYNQGLPFVELDREKALRYLKKENFEIDEKKTGWHLIKYEGLNLGWVKLLGHRFNNYLPKEWRIKMDIEPKKAI
ncbi:MAG: RNA methyltransferase [Bacteroidota bacterium]